MALFGRRERGPAALPVPPFPPDPPASPAADVAVPDDPVALLAAHGVVLPEPVELVHAAPDLPVWTLPVEDGYPGTELWASVRAVHGRTGLWPVLIDDRMWESTAAGLGGVPDPVGFLDGGAWLQSRADSFLAEVRRGGEVPWSPPDDGLDWDDLVASLPQVLTTLLLVPSPAGWAVPGRLGWSGAVNADILGDAHTAVLRRWSARWDVEVVGMGLDTLALRVGNPPATPDAALAAAVEMTMYCSDLVFQGVETLDALVPLAASSAWYLWWD